MKKADIIIEHLKSKGSKELPSTSRKYRKFTHPTRENAFYWVGKSGALRAGRTAGDSISLTHYHFINPL